MRIHRYQKKYQRRMYMERLEAMTGAVENPIRIRRQRSKGWVMPENTIYVGRPTMWGNPFSVHPDEGGRRLAVQLFREWLEDEWNVSEAERREWNLENVHLLRGVNLACFCPLDEPCHADVLMELANA